MWLVHKGGFASASQLKGDGLGLPEGRVKIRLDHGGEILEVDEDDVEKVSHSNKAHTCKRILSCICCEIPPDMIIIV